MITGLILGANSAIPHSLYLTYPYPYSDSHSVSYLYPFPYYLLVLYQIVITLLDSLITY